MQVKQLLLKLKGFGLDITALKTKDTELENSIKALQEQVGNIDVSQEIQTQITEALTEFKKLVDAADAELKTAIDAAVESIVALETKVDGKADAVHTHEANDIVESDEKQFISAAKKAQYDENTIFSADMLTVSGLGGIAAGTDLNDMPVQDVLTKLLFPYVAPTLSVSSTPNGGTFEKGNNQNVTKIRAVVGKKSEKITQIVFKDGSTVLHTLTEADGIANGGTFDYDTTIAVSSDKNFRVEVKDTTNKVVGANTGGFSFVYPYYFGVVSADNASIDEAELKAMTKKIEGKGNKQHSYTCNNERMVIAYPKSHGALKTIIDPNGFDNFASFARAEVSVTGLDGSAQTYYVYINGASTVNGFTMKFNY